MFSFLKMTLPHLRPGLDKQKTHLIPPFFAHTIQTFPRKKILIRIIVLADTLVPIWPPFPPAHFLDSLHPSVLPIFWTLSSPPLSTSSPSALYPSTSYPLLASLPPYPTTLYSTFSPLLAYLRLLLLPHPPHSLSLFSPSSPLPPPPPFLPPPSNYLPPLLISLLFHLFFSPYKFICSFSSSHKIYSPFSLVFLFLFFSLRLFSLSFVQQESKKGFGATLLPSN